MTEEAKRCVKALRFKEDFECIECPIPAGNCEENCLLDVAADLIESLSERNSRLEYTLVGVMHFVDKWLNGIEPYSIIDDNDGQIAIERAAEARRITLEYIEGLQRQLDQVTSERDAAVRYLNLYKPCDACGLFELQGDNCRKCRNDTTHPHWKWRGVEVENGNNH